MRLELLGWFAAAMTLVACGGELIDPIPQGGENGGGNNNGGGNAGGAGGGGPLAACDPLQPSFCGFPFPSNFNTIADEATPTGLRVAFSPDGLPVSKNGHVQDTAPWSKADGFSPGSAMLAHFPGAVGDGLPDVLDPASSLDPAALTVILDAETGERVLHYSEIDHHGLEEDASALLIHPAVPLKDGTRYIVAIRGLVDAAGDPIEPSPAFKALRDDETSDDATVEARRDLYTDIFSILDEASIDKTGLLLAWDFTTASRASNTDWLVHMRDDALEQVGTTGPAYTITSVDSDLDPATIMFRVKGTMTVPLYLDQPEPGASLLFGDDGLPKQNEKTPTYEAEWELLIPQIAATQKVALLQYGHGLLGSQEDVESDYFRTIANVYGYAVFSTKWIGLAEEDEAWISTQIADGKLDELTKMFDRLHQGILNNLLIMRMMSGGMANDATYGQYLDGTKQFYWGISQGGISGGVYMALSPDVQRGILEVMGQPYNLLLNRSVDFDPFFIIVGTQFEDARAQQLFLGLVQMNWDRVEPNGYSKYIFDDPFPGTPANRRILMRAIGDHQVSTFGGHVMARAMNAKHLYTGLRDVYGLEKVTDKSIDEDGAIYTEYSFGQFPEPTCNLPLSTCEDPHGKLRRLVESQAQLHIFFLTGVSDNRCAGLVCDFAAQSGCVGGEDADLCD